LTYGLRMPTRLKAPWQSPQMVFSFSFSFSYFCFSIN
jgi:hypothetical protein